MEKSKRIVFLIIDLICMIVLFAIDRITKIMAFTKLKDKDPYRLLPNVFEFRYLENRGAAFGMLQDQRILFIVVGVVFLVIILASLIALPATKKYRALRVCLVMIGAGAAGNLYDRIIYDYVTDFLYFVYIDFPIFNVADIYVTLSAFMLVILFLFIYKDEDLDIKKVYESKLHSSMRMDDKTGGDEGKAKDAKDTKKGREEDPKAGQGVDGEEDKEKDVKEGASEDTENIASDDAESVDSKDTE
jgi:signal peptidase II